MGTEAVTRSLAVLSLQPIKGQFPQRRTLKIALSWLHPCQLHPNEGVQEMVAAAFSMHWAWPESCLPQTAGSAPWAGGAGAGGAIQRVFPWDLHGTRWVETPISSGEQEAFSKQGPSDGSARKQIDRDEGWGGGQVGEH